MKNLKVFFLFVLFGILLSGVPAKSQGTIDFNPAEFNCFSMLVGKDATDNGSVYFAHNEDDYGKQLVNWYVIPAQEHPEGTEITLKNGGRLNQVEKTWRFIWLELPGMDFSDSYLNEHGVCIASNSCPSREDDPSITDGGIGYRLRGLMAERATSARSAVQIAGQLIEKFGYTGSGRTYLIADPNEAWALAAVRGKHWVAQRVPDDHIMVLPNHYTIQEIDLTDTENFLAAPDLIDYAIERGWYNPDEDGAFNFRQVYSSRGSMKHPGNVNRAWGAYQLLNKDYQLTDEFPFSFKPEKKISKEDLMAILASHYEGTELDKSEGYTKGSPYKLNGSMICNRASVHGFVGELRSWLPVDIGCVLWLAPQWPDLQPFIPWYAGITHMPEAYARKGYLNSLQDHYTPPEDIHVRNDEHAFWAYVNYSDMVNADYANRIELARHTKNKIQKTLFRTQARFEKKTLKKYKKDVEKGRERLTKYTLNLADMMLELTRKQLKK